MPVILLASILLGGAAGWYFGESVQWIKPFGTLFLNLIFTTIVPLVFFNVSSAIARAGSIGKVGRVFSAMTGVFVFTSFVVACFAILIVILFPPAADTGLTLAMTQPPVSDGFFNQIAGIFTVPDFSRLLSHEHMLALIVFSILVGLAAASTDNKSGSFITFLQSGEAVFMRVFSLIMLYAPVGFFAWFAVLTSELGPALMQSYVRVAVIYYLFAFIWFILAYTVYAFLAGRTEGVVLYWKHVFLPAATSLATCSSIASIPASLVAANGIRVPAYIAETTVPLGSVMHKDGSVIGGVIKIAFLFGVFHLNFSGIPVIATALGVSMLVGTVMGAIPGGGMLGELLILSVYGFPPSALIAISAISIIIDPLATMLNVTGNTVSSMMIARLVEGKKWLKSYKKTMVSAQISVSLRK